MKLEQILGAVREHYLGNYREEIRAYREQFRPGGPEVLLELSRDVAPAYRYYRIDLASGAVEPPNLTEVNPASHLQFPPEAHSHSGVAIELSPLVWNGVEFSATPPLSQDGNIQAWALRWLDLEEEATPDQDGLGACIHSITVPDHSDGATRFSVDFGSAPVRSVLELLEVLAAANVTSVELHSRSVLAE